MNHLKDEEINEIRAKIDDLNASDSIKEKLRKELNISQRIQGPVNG